MKTKGKKTTKTNLNEINFNTEMTKVLYRTFKKIINKYKRNNIKVWQIGDFWVFNLNKELMVFVSFISNNGLVYTTNYIDAQPNKTYPIYDSVLFKLQSRKKGLLDCFSIKFCELFKSVSSSYILKYEETIIRDNYSKDQQISNNQISHNWQASYLLDLNLIFSSKFLYKNNKGVYVWSDTLTDIEESQLIKELETYIDIWS